MRIFCLSHWFRPTSTPPHSLEHFARKRDAVGVPSFTLLGFSANRVSIYALVSFLVRIQRAQHTCSNIIIITNNIGWLCLRHYFRSFSISLCPRLWVASTQWTAPHFLALYANDCRPSSSRYNNKQCICNYNERTCAIPFHFTSFRTQYRFSSASVSPPPPPSSSLSFLYTFLACSIVRGNPKTHVAANYWH